MKQVSPAEWLASQPALLEEELKGLSPEQMAILNWKWENWWARPNQCEPSGDWSTWLILAGRGFGKTRTGMEWVRKQALLGVSPIAIVAETSADARDVLVEGQSGILRISPKHERPYYEPSKRRLTWPNGVVATLYNGTEPDQLRGPEHAASLVDELAKYAYPEETWDMLQFGLRVGEHPRVVCTTTPRPIKIIRDILKDPSTHVTRGATFDNESNLPKKFINTVRTKYEGTRLGRQELFAEMLDDVPGALWTRDMFRPCWRLPPMKRIVVGVDPSGAASEDDEASDEIGIAVAGEGEDGNFYAMEDASLRTSPDGWARRTMRAYREHKGDKIVAERNFGGAMVESTLRTVFKNAPIKMVSASRGKTVRAEPIAALYEQGRVLHYRDPHDKTGTKNFDLLEDQLVQFTSSGWVGDGSPDRADALIWALTELHTKNKPESKTVAMRGAY